MRRSVFLLGDRRTEVREEQVPEPALGEALVEVRTSAISAGTELLFYRGDLLDSTREAPEVDLGISALARPLSYPLRYGYASVGVVIAVGSREHDDWLGRRVFCFEPHSSHALTAITALHPVPDAVPDRRAVFLANAETALALVQSLGPIWGERILVVGLGVVGSLVLAMLDRLPLGKRVGLDREESRVDLLRGRLGSEDSLELRATSVATRGDFDAAIEVSGNLEGLVAAIEEVGFGGRIVIGSWYPPTSPSITLGTHFHRSQQRLESVQVSRIPAALTARWTKPRRFAEVWRFLESFPAESLITHQFPIESAGEAYTLLDQKAGGVLQVVLTYPER